MAFVAQCLEVPRHPVPMLYDPPPLGAFVKIGKQSPPTPPGLGAGGLLAPPQSGAGGPDVEEEDPFASRAGVSDAATLGTALPAATYALVYGANTASLEPNRRPSALGFADEDELRAEQPQIFELLRTEFSGLLIAYAPGGGHALRRHLPPTPPRIHSRVYLCSAEEVRVLTADLSFLRGLLLPTGGVLAGVPTDELAAACLRGARGAQADDQEFLRRMGRTLALLLPEDYERLQAIMRSIL